MHIEHELTSDDDKATILIEGLVRDLRILHVTDSHMAEGDDRDPDALEHVTIVGGRFAERTPGGVSAQQVFRETLQRGKEQTLDAAAFTGDMIHFPSYRGIEVIAEGMAELGVPTLYTLGNHDWHFPHLPWNNETRAEHYPRFHSITDGNPTCHAIEVEGVRLITIDNSNYQVTAEQVAFLREQLGKGQPSLLFIHIPICIESLVPAVMEMWKAPIMMAADEGWSEQTREQWRVPGDEAATRECHELLVSGDTANLAGIFCGHVHFPHADAYRDGRYQYVTTPGFAGGSRIIELKGR